jgi:hypothetical protein
VAPAPCRGQPSRSESTRRADELAGPRRARAAERTACIDRHTYCTLLSMNQQHVGSESAASGPPATGRGLAEQGRDELFGQLQRALNAVAKYATSSSPQRLLRDAGNFAGREPALALGGAFLLGATLARFMVSSRGAEHLQGSPGVTSDANTGTDLGGSGVSGRSSARDIPPHAPAADCHIGVGSPIGSGSHAGGSA